MKPLSSNGKKVVWESKTKHLFTILIAIIFTAMGIYVHEENKFLSVILIIFFGGGAIGLLAQLLNPKNLFVTHKSKLGKEILQQQFIDAQKTLGFFSYSDNGFTFLDKAYLWNEVSSVFAFKEDLITTDEVCVDIFMIDNSSLRIDESTPGWFQFTKRLNNRLSISDEWENNVMHPAFATNMTLLFDRQGRTPEQCEAALYN
jgi:hypothetical protein